MLMTSSDVFMDSVNRDVSMEMMVGPRPCCVFLDEADNRHRSNSQGGLAASSSYSVGFFPPFSASLEFFEKFPAHGSRHKSSFKISSC